MLRLVGSATLMRLKMNTRRYWECVERAKNCRTWFRGIPALEHVFLYIQEGKQPEDTHIRDLFIKEAKKLGWEIPEHLKK